MASLLRNSKFLKCAKTPETKFYSTRNAASINGRVYGLTFFVSQRRSRFTSASSKDSEEYEYIQRSRVPTMHFQASLPRLPIPRLEDSCRKYLSAQRPILTKDEWKETTSRVSQFLANDGQQLQKQLVDEDARNKHTSYISEPWFHMYLKDRKPLPINYNPLLVFEQESKSGYNDQLVKATNLVVSSARFMKSLRAEILEPEVYHLNPKKSDTTLFRSFTRLLPSSISWYGAYLMKAYPLDMSQYPNLFGTTRIPEIGKDRIAHNPAARHVAVLRKGHFYAFDILNENGNIRPAREIASSLKEILADPRETNQCPIGSFTTCDRDEWAKNRQHLVKLGSNDRVLEKIDSAAFLLILDDDAVNEDIHKMLRKFLHGSSDNRWFDKSYSLIVARDGYAGVNFEHSWGDGVAILRYFRDIKNDIATKPRFHPEEVSDLPSTAAVEKLDIVVDAEVKQKVDLAVSQYSKWIDRLSIDYLLYDGFGKKECKQFGVSPDAVMQVAFQLALYKLEGRAVATYESCSTSAFKHGRTETIRSCTNETQALCSAIVKQGKSGVSNSDLKKLMLDCSKAHGNLVKEGAMGQGFDRHLFALKNLWEKSNQSGSMPPIFTDPAYAKLNHNILSTSTLSSPEVKAGGFGPVVQDGYGIGYMILDHILGSVVTSYKEHRDAAVYVESLSSAVKDIHGIMKST